MFVCVCRTVQSVLFPAPAVIYTATPRLAYIYSLLVTDVHSPYVML